MVEKRIVKIGIGKLDVLMTKSQARQYGEKNMPSDLRKAGFKTDVATSDQEMHGGLWYRISYGK